MFVKCMLFWSLLPCRVWLIHFESLGASVLANFFWCSEVYPSGPGAVNVFNDLMTVIISCSVQGALSVPSCSSDNVGRDREPSHESRLLESGWSGGDNRDL